MGTRRSFIKQSFAGTAFITAGGISGIFGSETIGRKKAVNERIRIILQLSNDGKPSLFSYGRVIVTVKPF